MLIRASDIVTHKQSERFLDHVSLEIARGEIVTIIGPNGAGKSSLVRVLIGAEEIASGRIERAGGLKLGYVPQALGVEQIMPISVRHLLGLPSRPDKPLMKRLMQKLAIVHLQDVQISALSGGELKRVLLAHALAHAPDLLILDEPTAGLDQQSALGFYGLVEELRAEEGMAILLVSHDLNMVMKSSDRVICLNRHICCEGAPIDVQADPQYLAMMGAQMLAPFAHDHDHHHAHGDLVAPPGSMEERKE